MYMDEIELFHKVLLVKYGIKAVYQDGWKYMVQNNDDEWIIYDKSKYVIRYLWREWKVYRIES